MLGSFIVGGIVLLFGLPMLMVAGSSLFSKLIPQSIQGQFGGQKLNPNLAGRLTYHSQ